MFKLIVSGNVGKQAEVKEINGQLCMQFSIAHNEKSRNAQGQTIESTTWILCSQWKDKNGRFPIAEHLKPGTRILVEGKPAISTYKDRTQQTQAGFQLRVTDIHFMGGNNKEQQPATQEQQPAAPAAPAAATEIADDLPF